MKTIASILWLIIASIPLCAQQSGGNPTAGEPLQLLHADSLVKATSDNTIYQFAQGHVRFRHGNVLVWCNRANFYEDENRSQLIGNVKIVQGTVTLTAPSADYNGNTRIATGTQGVKIIDRITTLTAKSGRYSTQSSIANFYGDVRVEDDSVAIDADTIEYHRSTENSYASGNILMEAKRNHAFIKGDSSVNFPSLNYSRVVGNAILYQMDTLAVAGKDSLNTFPKDTLKRHLDTFTIASNLMESYRGKNERYIATGKVEMVRGELASRCDTAYFEKHEERVRLRGTPIVWYDSTQLSADSIIVYLPKQRLKKIESYSRAFSVSRDDTLHFDRANQLSGSAIFISVDADTLREVFAKGDAKSLYFLLKEQEPDGVARHSADSIRITMENGKPEVIRWLGGVNGENFPEKMVAKKTKDFYLPAWHWETNRPKKRVFNPSRKNR
jgi:lipopolysaccharide export system protein LptA